MTGLRLVSAVLSGLALVLTGCSLRGDQPQRGKVLVGWYGCASCHDIPDAPRAGWVGPALDGIARRAYLAGRLPNTPENMIRWIRYPHQVDELTVMPNMNVTEQDAREIASYLYTLR